MFNGLYKRFRVFTGPISITTRNRSFNIGGRNGIRVTFPGTRIFGGQSAGWRRISPITSVKRGIRNK